jgi:hypothetical protein
MALACLPAFIWLATLAKRFGNIWSSETGLAGQASF